METSKETLDILKGWRDIAEDFKKPFSEEWEENERFYLGSQWDDKYLEDLPEWRATNTVNMIYPLVEQALATIGDTKNIAFVRRRAKGSQKIERMLTAIIEQIWHDQKIVLKSHTCDRYCVQFGTSFFKVEWDDKDKSSILPIKVTTPPPHRILVDPNATSVNDVRFVMEYKYCSMADVMDLYPDKIDEIQESSDKEFKDVFDQDGAIVDSPRVLVWEVYFKDSTLLLEHEVSEDEDGEIKKKVKASKKKYPNGRKIKWVGDVILEDTKNEFTFFPYIRTQFIPVGENFWGMSFISPLKHTQEQINHIDSMTYDYLRSNIYPMFIAPSGLIDPDMWIACPNNLVETRLGIQGNLERIQQTVLPPDAYNIGGKKSQELMLTSGLNEASFGNTVGSSRPGTVQAKQQAGQARLRRYIDQKNASLSDLGTCIIEILQKKVKANTVVNIADPEGNFIDLLDPENFKDLLEGLQNPRIRREMSSMDVTLNQPNDEYEQAFQEKIGAGLSADQAEEIIRLNDVHKFKNNLSDGRYEYYVDVHPVQSGDDNSEFQKLLEYMKYGGQVHPKVMVSLLDIPNKAEILRDMKVQELAQKAQMQAQQQAMMQQQAQQPAQQGA